MTLINIRPREIYSNARELILKANRIEESIKEVDKQLNTLSEEVFSGESASRLREDYKKYRAQLLSSSKTIRYFAYSLIEIAHDLEAADQKQFFSLGIFAGISGILTGFLSKIFPGWNTDKREWLQFESSPEVKGENIELSDRSGGNYENLSWVEKFKELENLKSEHSKLKEDIQSDPEVIKAKIAEIDDQIAHTEKAMAEAQQESEKLINKIVRQDGKPLSELYQDVAEDYKKQLDELQTIRDVFQSELQTANKAAQVNAQIEQLTEIINKGITPDGPTKTDWVNRLGGCTHFIATEKRDVSECGRRNATFWNDDAKIAGYEVGSRPVVGSIVVFEANSHGFRGGGHVGYVESVELVNGNYEITYSSANTIFSDTAPDGWIRGVHKENPIWTKTISIGGDKNINYIYEKP